MKERLVQAVQDALIDLFIERRKARGLSHEKLAALAGMHRTGISHIENRKRNPTLIVCLKLARALDCPLSDLIKMAEARSKKRL
jgi:transcriptional regulator with XRE-family HTH domain